MTAKELLRDAKAEFLKVIKGAQNGSPVEGGIQAGLKYLEGAWETYPTDDEKEEIRHLECLAHCANEDYDAANEIFKRANTGREVPHEWRELGATIKAVTTLPSDLGVALQECNQAIDWFVEDDQNSVIKAILYGRKGFCHLKLGRQADAIACCDIASRLIPQHLPPLRIMAEIMLRQGDHEAAIEHLSRVIASRTEGPFFWDYANRGNAFLEIGNVQEALRDLEIALGLQPNSALILSNIGLAMDRLGDVTQAWRYYSRALMHDFEWVPAHNNRGSLFFARGDYNAAEQEFSIALRSEPNNAHLWFNRALSRYEQGMHGECLSDLAAADRRGNRSWETQYITAMCKGRLQEYSTATAILRTLALGTGFDRETSSIVWNNIGVMEHRAGNLEKAERCFAEATSENPLNAQAQANLDKLVPTMSGADLRATEEESLEIFPRTTTSQVLGLTPSDALTSASIATNLVLLAAQL